MPEEVPAVQNAGEQNSVEPETMSVPSSGATHSDVTDTTTATATTARQDRLNSGSHFKKSAEHPSYFGVGHTINVKAAAAAIDAAAANAGVETSSGPEETRRVFLEEVMRRKVEAEVEKLNQAQAQANEVDLVHKTETGEKVDEQPVVEAEAETSKSEDVEAPVTDGKADVQPSDQSVPESLSSSMSFAQRLKLKKQQREAEQTDSRSGETPAAKTETPAPSSLGNPALQAIQSETAPRLSRPRTPITPLTPVSDTTPRTVVDPNVLTVSKIIDRVHKVPGIEDPYEFKYPETFEPPSTHYKREHIKYTYGPTFLLQFKDQLRVYADPEWVQNVKSRIVIPPGMSRSNRSKSLRSTSSGSTASLASGGSGAGAGLEFRSVSMRGDFGGMGSRASSKRKSKRDDRRSNRSYTGRRDRERTRDRPPAEDRSKDEDKDKNEGKEKASEAPKVEEVAPLVPSANRWVPKFRQKKTEEKKLAPDGVTELLDKDEVERKMKSLLNKLTLEKFDPISADILSIANQSKWETDGVTLRSVIEQIFLKACDEPHWSSMYAQLCGKIVKDIDSEVKDETNDGKTGQKLVLFYLVDRCHTEFEKGWTDKLPTNPDGTPLEPEMMSDEYYQAAAAKRRGLGLVRFIGFLYRLNLLTTNMMFECFRKLMKELNDKPSEEILESVSELLNTVGEKFENDKFSSGQAVLEGSRVLDLLFERLHKLIDAGEISSRVRFKLMDVAELREEKNWVSDKKDTGPKTIQQIHQEEEVQRMIKMGSRANSRSSSRRGNPSNRSRREPPVPPPRDRDNFIATRSYSQRGSQRASFRAVPQREEAKPAPAVASNRFSALMNHEEDE